MLYTRLEVGVKASVMYQTRGEVKASVVYQTRGGGNGRCYIPD